MFMNHKTRNDLYAVKKMNNILCKITSADRGSNQNRIHD